MTTVSKYDPRHTGLLHVDPYNDFITAGGKLWERAHETIEGTGLLEHTRELIAAARRLGIRRFIRSSGEARRPPDEPDGDQLMPHYNPLDEDTLRAKLRRPCHGSASASRPTTRPS